MEMELKSAIIEAMPTAHAGMLRPPSRYVSAFFFSREK